MEESFFRQLLSRSANTVLDQHTLAKGADYLRRGRVREVWYERSSDAGTLFGSVQGREANAYTAAILIGLNGGKPRFDTQCTCPLEGECKHVAAIALKMLGTRGEISDPAPPVNGARTDPGAWKPWFDALSAQPKQGEARSWNLHQERDRIPEPLREKLRQLEEIRGDRDEGRNRPATDSRRSENGPRGRD